MGAPAAAPAGVIERMYYAVQTGGNPYVIGGGGIFPGTPAGHAEACDAARASIKRIDYSMLRRDGGDTPDGWTRAWVEKRYVIRWADGSGVDEPVSTTEMFLTDEQKAAVAAGEET